LKGTLRGALHGAWTDEQIIDANVNAGAATMTVTVQLGGTVYSATALLKYSAKAGKAGRFKK